MIEVLSTPRPQLIPEGAGPVKATAGCFFRLFARFLILVGASKLASGVKARAEPDRVSGRRALTSTPFGARCSGQENRKGLVACFRLAEQGVGVVFKAGFPA